MAWRLPEDAVLGIFAKQPVAGAVKTRLGDAIGQEAATELSEAMLLDLLELWGGERILAAGGRRVLVYAPAGAGPWFDEHAPRSFALQPQVEGSLGERMAAFLTGELADGAKRVVLVGSDSPTLDPSILISAFLCLEQKDLVLGPATDGGYYLIGCRGPVPPVFEEVDWGGDSVLATTLSLAERAGRSLAMLPPWYDVDEPRDLLMLSAHLRGLRLSGCDPGLPRLERWFTRFAPLAPAPGRR